MLSCIQPMSSPMIKTMLGFCRHTRRHTNGEECKQSGPKFSHGLHGKPPYLSGVRGGNCDRRTPHGIVLFLFQTRAVTADSQQQPCTPCTHLHAAYPATRPPGIADVRLQCTYVSPHRVPRLVA